MAEKMNLARLKKFGLNFEVSIDPSAALQYKKGEISDLRDVLQADGIFADAKKGLHHTKEELEKVFQTSDEDKIAHIILTEGEIQDTAEHRSQEREQRWKQLIGMIAKQAVDPNNDLPHPPTRIEAALNEAKFHLEDHKSVEQQFPDAIHKIRPIIPIKIEQKELTIKIGPNYAAKSYNLVTSNAKLLSETWNPDGSWSVKVELPAGMVPDFMEKLNSFTHGEVVIE